MSAYVYQKTFTWLFIVALFIVTQNCKQSKNSLSVGEWMNKLWCIHMMKHYTSIFFKKNEQIVHKKHLVSWILDVVLSESRYKRVHIIHVREHAVWFHLYGVQEQARQSWSMVIVTTSHQVVTSGVGVGLPRGTSWGTRNVPNVLYL